MNNKVSLIKSIIKKDSTPNPKFGTNPSDPWSPKANIPEETEINENDLLNKYLKSQGYNPKVSNRNFKISRSKMGAFKKWMQDRVRGGRLPEEYIEEGNSLLNAYLRSKGLNPEHITTVQKIAYTKNKQFQKWLRDHISGGKINLTSAKYREGGLPEEHNRLVDIIKSVHREKVMEDLYDHEKEDKSVATYGKKPKHDKTSKDDNLGENKPTAAAVLSGGTTLTGQKRDTIEIDPMMRLRPGQPDPTKDKKKEDKKKDK